MRFYLPSLVGFSVGSNPNIMNFEPLQTWQVKLQTRSNPTSSTKTELQTYSESSKYRKLQTCLARSQIWAEPRPKSGQTKLWTLSNPGLSTKTKLWAHPNPPKIQNSKSTIWVRLNTSWVDKGFLQGLSSQAWQGHIYYSMYVHCVHA